MEQTEPPTNLGGRMSRRRTPAQAALDNTQLARDINQSVPAANEAYQRALWREDLKQRVRARLEANRRANDNPTND